jgi:hypothetical protein
MVWICPRLPADAERPVYLADHQHDEQSIDGEWDAVRSLRRLDGGARTFREDVRVLIRALQGREQEPLVPALRRLVDPSAFKPSVSELVALRCVSACVVRPLEYEEDMCRVVDLRARRAFLRRAQAMEGSLEESYMEVRQESTKERVASLPLSEREQTHLVHVIMELEGATGEALMRCGAARLESVYRQWEALSSGAFAPLLRLYPVHDLEARLPDWVWSYLEGHGSLFAEEIAGLCARWAGAPFRAHLESYVDHKIARHGAFCSWIARHAAHIVVSYCQGADVDRNLGRGNCGRNALDRQALLQQEPALPAQEIPMGSTHIGRFLQVLCSEEKDNRRQRAIRRRELECRGLRHAGRWDLQGNAQGREARVIVKLACRHAKPMTLQMRPQEGVGHVINIQADPARGIFRFIDDNVGICVFASPKELCEGLHTWLQASYDHMVHFKLQAYAGSL